MLFRVAGLDLLGGRVPGCEESRGGCWTTAGQVEGSLARVGEIVDTIGFLLLLAPSSTATTPSSVLAPGSDARSP